MDIANEAAQILPPSLRSLVQFEVMDALDADVKDTGHMLTVPSPNPHPDQGCGHRVPYLTWVGPGPGGGSAHQACCGDGRYCDCGRQQLRNVAYP